MNKTVRFKAIAYAFVLSVFLGSMFGTSANALVKAAEYPYFKVVSWTLRAPDHTQATQMINGRRYSKFKDVYVQYYGYYVVESYPGSAIDAACKLYINQTSNTVNITLDSFSQETYNSEPAVKIVCNDSEVFSLQEGKNTIYLGGAVVFQGMGVIPYPAKYGGVVYYYDSTKPTVELNVVRTPTNQCTQSAAESKSQECWLGIKYRVIDPNDGRLKYAKLYKQVEGQENYVLWKTIDLAKADGNWHTLTYNLKTLGITAPGTYNVKFKLEAEDEVSNKNQTELTVGVTIHPDTTTTPAPSTTVTQSPTSTPTQTPEGQDKTNTQVSNTLEVNKQSADNGKTEQESGVIKLNLKDPKLYGLLVLIILAAKGGYDVVKRYVRKGEA